jgi:hypothetical protein
MKEVELIDLLSAGKRLEQGIYEFNFDKSIDRLILSWNCILDESQCIALSFRVGTTDEWSETFMLGHWEVGKDRKAFARQEKDFGTLDIDHFKARSQMEIDRLRVYIKTLTGSPVELRGLYASVIYDEHHIMLGTEKREYQTCQLQAPALVQFPVEGIGNRICSPTTCAMMLAQNGVQVSPFEMASRVYDSGNDIYGNWSFNIAAVSQFGAKAAARHVKDLYTLNKLLCKGERPLGASVKTGKHEVFTGALQAYPSGHLLLVTGFIKKKHKWYVCVNDPADHSTETAARMYPVEEFERYFSGVCYQFLD